MFFNKDNILIYLFYNFLASKGKVAIYDAVNRLSEISCIQLTERGIWSIQYETNYIIFKFGVG